MTLNDIQSKINAILFASGEPVEGDKIAEVLGISSEELNADCKVIRDFHNKTNTGLCLVTLDDKYQLCTDKEYADIIRQIMNLKKNAPLSSAAFEVLAIVAYNQPVTKAFIEQIRGVDCSGVISSLMQKGLIEEKGRLDLPGRPLLYGTTPDFLRCFCISDLDELPALPEREEKTETVTGDSKEENEQLSFEDN